jgi:TrpR-related protein YerC/YecD
MNDKLKDAATDLLFSAILSLRTIDECYAFFEDICTIAELKSLTQRLHVAMMLQQGRTYTEICDETGVSTATISRVNRSLEYGADGYKTVLDRLAAAGLYPDSHPADGKLHQPGKSSAGPAEGPHAGTRKD